MLSGRYVGSSLRPVIDAHRSIPSIKAGGFVQFLIDTGADCTTITPADGKRLRVDFNKLTDEDHSIGYTGSTVDFICQGIVTFAEIGIVEYEYDIELRLTKPDPNIPELLLLPSLLGRDILNQWQMSFDPKVLAITANVLSCDRKNPLSLSDN
jgi:hypothetical protein